MVTPRRGDVVWARLDGAEGHEQRGERPVLVLSDNGYTARFKLAVVVPLTTRDKWPEPLQVALGVVGEKVAWALPGQVRTLSVSRLGNVEGVVPLALVERTVRAVAEICGVVSVRADNDG